MEMTGAGFLAPLLYPLAVEHGVTVQEPVAVRNDGNQSIPKYRRQNWGDSV